MSHYSLKQKTQSLLYIEKAVFECLEGRVWSSLTVSEVCRQAGISRKTFYRHFSGISDCLEGWFERLAEEYLRNAQPLDGYDIDRISKEFFAFWSPYKGQLKILELSGFDLQTPFLKSARKIIEARAGENRENLLLFSSGGFYNLWIHWIQSGLQTRKEGQG